MSEVTHLEHLGHLAWLKEQWNKPTKLDHYITHLIWEIRRSYVKHPGRVKKPKLLEFEFRQVGIPERSDLDIEERSYLSHKRWSAMMTMPITILED